jgi:hypothetical protein
MPVGGLVPRAPDNAADLVVRNAKIHTGDAVRPQAEAIAIRAGVITVVGDDNDVAPVIFFAVLQEGRWPPGPV